jgi:dihydropyrimidinase
MSRTLIRGGTIVSDQRVFNGDILVEAGRIVAVEKKIAAAGAERVIDASGCEVFPGGVDPHVHMELQTAAGRSSDDFASGTRAALAGGTTTVIDFVTPGRAEPLQSALAARKAAAQKSLCDYGLHMSVTAWSGRTIGELEDCCRNGGIASVKAYLAYKEDIGLEDRDFLSLLAAARKLGFITLVHAESGDMVSFLRGRLMADGKTAAGSHPLSRPPEVEGDAVARALLMARLAGAPLYVVHLSTRQGVEALAAARRLGQTAIGETCPQYLLLDESRYQGDAVTAARHVISPPLRAPEHAQALWQELATGLLQTVGSDHCPFTGADKDRYAASDFSRIPGGCGGVEYRLPLLYTFGVCAGRISLARFVDLVSTRPAQVFGLYPRKGTIRAGSDADIVVWDGGRKWRATAAGQWQRGDHTVYEGLELQGAPRLVLARGQAVYEDGRFAAEPGRGEFLARSRVRSSHGDGSR